MTRLDDREFLAGLFCKSARVNVDLQEIIPVIRHAHPCFFVFFEKQSGLALHHDDRLASSNGEFWITSTFRGRVAVVSTHRSREMQRNGIDARTIAGLYC